MGRICYSKQSPYIIMSILTPFFVWLAITGIKTSLLLSLVSTTESMRNTVEIRNRENLKVLNGKVNTTSKEQSYCSLKLIYGEAA